MIYLQSFYYLISYREGGADSSQIHTVKGQKAGGWNNLTFCDSMEYLKRKMGALRMHLILCFEFLKIHTFQYRLMKKLSEVY